MSEIIVLFVITSSWLGFMALFVYCMRHYPIQKSGMVCLACGVDSAFHNVTMRRACVQELKRLRI